MTDKTDKCSICLVTNKIYIGQTWMTLEKRWKGHCKRNIKRPLPFAINKYGKENFSIKLIGICYNQEDADNMEIFFIKRHVQ